MGSCSDALRAEIAADLPRASCCRKSFFYGLLYDADVEGERLSFSLPVGGGAIVELLGRQFSSPVSERTSQRFGHPSLLLSFSSRTAADKISAIGEGEIFSHFGFRCAECRKYFLRGLFFARGTLTLAAGDQLEYRLSHGERAPMLRRFFENEGLFPKTVERRSLLGLYFKQSDGIEGNLLLMGVKRPLWDLVNRRIERDMRRVENRATNCVTVNIGKAVDSAQREIRAIRILEESGRLASLDEDLRQTAHLRVVYESANLRELAARHEPPLSRSGLSHRLSRLLAEAAKVEGERKTGDKK